MYVLSFLPDNIDLQVQFSLNILYCMNKNEVKIPLPKI